ncbi:peptidase M14 [bacterium]|nr:peptidase M14 [bacterium]
MMKCKPFLFAGILWLCALIDVHAVEAPTGFHYINTSFENASPLHWDIRENGVIHLHLLYDHERNSPNRAAGHWFFRVEGEKGSTFRFVITNLENVWNKKKASPAKEKTICLKSTDGKQWVAFETELLEGHRLGFDLTMQADRMYIARVEPYRISDLQALFNKVESSDIGSITPIGQTAQGRELEIIAIDPYNAPHRVFIRARAHPWEPGGNWVVQGLVHELINNPENAKRFLQRFAVYILPMANKDGVAKGWTRFNVHGMDLNRNWDKPANPDLCPENHFLEQWLQTMIEKNKKPDLALDFHNDQGGRLHISRPNINLERYLANAKRFEELLYQHTFFTEGATGGNFRNPGTIGEGLLERFGIDGFVFELNANWIAGINDYPHGKHWETLGKQLLNVFYEYFK